MNPNKKSLIKPIQSTDDLKRRVMTIGFYGIAGFLGYKMILQPQIKKFRKKNEEGEVVLDENKRQATVLYNAMNPSGVRWMRNMDATDEEMLYEAARKITDWKEVQNSYFNLYNRSLLSDLEKEVSPKELKVFYTLLSNNPNGKNNNGSSDKNPYTKKGMLIVASKDIRLRSTPDSSVSAYSFNTNILGVAKAYEFLGWATGNWRIDNEGVKYLEVRINFTAAIPNNVFALIYKKYNNKVMTFWVGLGAVKQYSYYEQLFDAGVKLYKGVKDSGLRKNFK